MDLLLIEDEPPAMERLVAGVHAWDPAARVVGQLGSVADVLRFLDEHPLPVLMLMDLQLSDGLSLEVLRRAQVTCPVIVVTAYDEYVLEALALSCIDYLLKPIRPERLAQALDKYRTLQRHFAGDVAELLRLLGRERPAQRERVLARKGLDYVSLPLSEIAYFVSEHKLVFARHRSGARYLVEKPLAELEAQLDGARFQRLNRQYLAHVEAIRGFRPAEKGRLQIALEPAPAEPVLVSQERAGSFRDWLERR
jgi:DNA-binding LytR/AlgR family response regulator